MLLLSLLFSAASAADLDVSLGYEQTQMLDQHQSPLHYAGHGARVGLGVSERWTGAGAWSRLNIDVASFDARYKAHRLPPRLAQWLGVLVLGRRLAGRR
ncbi:MAG: hypothetical protein AB8H79_17360 [Myxococcota bacterium]